MDPIWVCGCVFWVDLSHRLDRGKEDVKGQVVRVPLTYVNPWYLLCYLGSLGDEKTYKYPLVVGLI